MITPTFKPGEVRGTPGEGKSILCEPITVTRGCVGYGEGDDDNLLVFLPFGSGGWTAIRMSRSVAIDLMDKLQRHIT